MQTIQHAVRKIAAEIDPWLGTVLDVTIPGYASEAEAAQAGAGVYTAEDWTRLRSGGSASCGTDGSEYDSDEKWLAHIFGSDGMNVIGAIQLAKAFDFGRYNAVFELGCGSMAQAYVLHRLYPRMRYLATDLDPYVITRCSQLPVLAGIEKRVLDVLSIEEDTDPFTGFDLLMSWGMEYALDDAQLLQLLTLVNRWRIPYLMCSATTVGLMKYLHFKLASRRRAGLLAEKRLRMAGWDRTLGRFRRLAREAGLKPTIVGRFGYHFCLLFNNR